MADSIFTDDELRADQTTATDAPPVVEETAEQKAERERDEQGRFKAKEDAAEGEDQQGGDDGKQKTVPQGALHAEREKRKASDQRADQLENELKTIREQMDALRIMREQIASRKPEDLPAADDPAALEHLRNRLSQLETGQTRLTQHMDTQALDQAERAQLGGFMQEAETAYRQQQPDYDAAIEHVVMARANELKLYGLNPAQIQTTIAEEATEIVRSAVAQGRNPAELGYQIALSRGYRPSALTEQKGGTDQSSTAQATLDAIAKAKAQGKSLGGSGGSAPKNLNAEAILALSPEEFDALYSTPEGKAMIDAL
jgi:hypothetical protein